MFNFYKHTTRFGNINDMADMQFGESYAGVYDLLYGEKDYAKEVEFLVDAVEKNSPNKVDKILSLGIGTANHEVLLAQRGYEIVGVDVSSQMISQAESKIAKMGLKDNVTLLQGDISKVEIEEKFDVTMAMFNVLGYQNENSQLESVLKNVSDLLNKKGIFLFDCWHAPAVWSDRPKEKKKVVRQGDREIVRKTKPRLIPSKNLLEISFELTEKRSDRELKITKEKHTMRYFTLPELAYYFSNAGMEIIDSCNFMDMDSKIGDKEWNIFLTVRKK